MVVVVNVVTDDGAIIAMFVIVAIADATPAIAIVVSVLIIGR